MIEQKDILVFYKDGGMGVVEGVECRSEIINTHI